MLTLCEIELRSVPKLVFACTIEYEHYKNRFPHTQNLLEISLIESGSICFDYGNGRTETIAPTMLPVITKDMVCTSYAKANERQKHTTVGVVADYTCTRRTVSTPLEVAELKTAVYEKNHILLPLQTPLEASYQSVLHGLRRIAAHYTASDPIGKLRAVSRWFALVGELTEFSLIKAEAICVPPSSLNYVRRAEQYLNTHYREPLKIPDVAHELNISVGYLQKIFAQVNNMSMTQYLNRHRIELAKQYIRSRRLPLNEIAELVGIEDPAYMSRLFRKIAGTSYQNYLREGE